jgi:hypothetical protein
MGRSTALQLFGGHRLVGGKALRAFGFGACQAFACLHQLQLGTRALQRGFERPGVDAE